MRYLLILALLAQTPKPLPSPKLAAAPREPIATHLPFIIDNSASVPPTLIQDNGRTIFTLKDEDRPVGPCDLGKLVRAGGDYIAASDRANDELKRILNGTRKTPALAEADAVAMTRGRLKAELARCSPPVKEK